MAYLFHQGDLLVRDGDQFIWSSISLLGQAMEENRTSVLHADELSSGWVQLDTRNDQGRGGDEGRE